MLTILQTLGATLSRSLVTAAYQFKWWKGLTLEMESTWASSNFEDPLSQPVLFSMLLTRLLA